jgi:predicted MFS family arabinose efflux permease
MNSTELRSAFSLSSIYALRMLGLFLILPIFTLHAQTLPGGDDALFVGIVLGIYGIVQAVCHIPLGVLSDRLGRRPVVVIGLVLFVLGALIAASHDDLWWILFGRAVQGAGAISAAVSAWVSDLTREEVRTQAMALIGGSIALSYVVSIVIAAPLNHLIGLQGIFLLMAILGIVAIYVAIRVVPKSPHDELKTPEKEMKTMDKLRIVLRKPELLRLNLGVLVLYIVQVMVFMIIPRILKDLGLPLESHWTVYLPLVLISFLVMAPLLMLAERRGRLRGLLVFSVGIMLFSQIYFVVIFGLNQSSLYAVSLGLFIFFVAFNILETIQPSLVSRLSGNFKGAALGVFNTTQSLGLFLGGALGGLLLKNWGLTALFYLTTGLISVWLIITFGTAELPSRAKNAQP